MDEPGTEALRKLAPQWSLAGDEQLLSILQNTHQRLLSKCHETNSQLEQMATALNDASVRLQNVNNQFMALSSSQFIESRVYDDDDVVPTEPATKETPQPSPTEELVSMQRGLGVLEASHEGITILHSDSDSDSEDDLPNRLVLKPRDLYADRPLPYIIGSQPWKSKWHAGLVVEDSDSESSTSKVGQDSDQYSSEQEDSPDRLQVPGTHTTISEASSSLPSEPGSLPKSAADVATDIARRLGGTEPHKVDQDPVYEEPVKPTTRKVYRPQDPVVSTVFPESPPPLSRAGSADSSASDIFAELHRPAYSQPQDHDLFHFHEDGDIFSDLAKPSEQDKPTSLFEAGPTPNMFKTTPEATVNQHDMQAEKGVKKPAGGISLFGKKDTESIGAAILKRNQRKSSSGDESGNDVKNEPKQPNEQTKTEKDIFDDLFARSEPKKIVKDKVNIVKDIQKEIVKKNEAKREVTKSVAKEKVDLFSDNLFDDIDDIFSTNVVKMPTNNNTKSIFDDDDDLFSEIAAPKVVKNEASTSNKKRETIFDSEDELFSENVSRTNEKVVKDEKPTIKENTKVLEPPKSLFEEDDDIFNDEKVTNKLKDTKINTIHETNKTNERKVIKPDKVTSFKSPSLFGDDDDDDIFNNTKNSNNDTILNDNKNENSTKNYEFKTNNENKNNNLDNAKINNNITNEIIEDKNVAVEKNVDSQKLPREATVEKPFKISNLLKKKESSSDTNDDFSDQDFEDFPPKVVKKIENINEQSISDNDLDIDMFKERNKAANLKDNAPYKGVKDNLDKDEHIFNATEAVKDTSKDKYVYKDAKYSSAEPHKPKDLSKKITENVEKDNDIFKGIKENTSMESHKPKDTFKDLKDNKQEMEKSEQKNIFKEEKQTEDIIKDVKDNEITDTDIFKEIMANTTSIKKEPIIEKAEEDNNLNNEIVSTTVTASIFADILSEPPVFEKPKEPKKSKNVNALFDDDSDDESLFFKKDDVISDEKPPDFKPAQDRLFGIFTDEPPDDDFKAGSDDDLFSSLPKPKVPQNLNRPTPTMAESQKPTPTMVENLKPTPTIAENLKPTPTNEDIFENLLKSETTVETQKLPISTIEKDEDKIPIYEKLDAKPPENEDPDILGANDLFTKEFKPKQFKKIESLSDDENLFAATPKEDLPLPKDSSLENIIKDTDDIFQDKPKSESLKNILDSDENLFKIPKKLVADLKLSKSEENTHLGEKGETKKVGKLKLGLNINVNALLPGASPKKTKISDQTDGQAQSQTQIPDKNVDTRAIPDPDLPKSVSFDGNPDSEVLDNKLSKERPRIQVKRRPSTRRARKEAVRKSGIDFGEDSTDNSSSIDDPPKRTKNEIETAKGHPDAVDGEIRKFSDEIEDLDKTHTQVETEAEMQAETTEQDEIIRPTYKRDVKSKIVYILNDEDIFNSPVEKTDAIEKSEDPDQYVDSNPGVSTLGQVYEKTDKIETKSSLFNDDDNDDDDEIFKGKDIKKKTIFDSDSDEELFGNKKEKVKVKEVKKDINVKVSLFGDESDDDDLFGVKTKKVVEPKPQPTRASVKETPTTSAPVFEDPLSMFGNED